LETICGRRRYRLEEEATMPTKHRKLKTAKRTDPRVEISEHQLGELLHIADDLTRTSPAGAEADAGKIRRMVNEIRQAA
jgi:hypothetical protein